MEVTFLELSTYLFASRFCCMGLSKVRHSSSLETLCLQRMQHPVSHLTSLGLSNTSLKGSDG